MEIISMELLFFMLLFFSPSFVWSQEETCTGVICPPFHNCSNGACVCQHPRCQPPPVLLMTITASTTTAAVDVCASSPCQNGCKCVSSCKHENGYFCEGPDGYLGKNCEMPAPLLTCAANEISVTVDAGLLDSLYQGVKEDICVYLGPIAGKRPEDKEACEVCTKTRGNYTIRLPIPFLNCETSALVADDGQTIFTNMIWTDLRSSDYSIPKPVVNFQCTYAQEYSMVLSMSPTVESNKPFLEGLIQLQGTIELCKAGNFCPAACPSMYSVTNGAVYTISETIHVILSMRKSSMALASRRAVLQELYLSCNSVGALPNENVYLVVGECETSVLSTRIDRARSTGAVICTSFKVPRMLQCNVFYIHALIRISDDFNLPICSEPIRKVRRSDDDYSDSVIVRSGPIFIIEGSKGHPDSSIVLTNDEFPEGLRPVRRSGNNIFIMIAITGSVTLLLIIVAVAYFQFRRC